MSLLDPVHAQLPGSAQTPAPKKKKSKIKNKGRKKFDARKYSVRLLRVGHRMIRDWQKRRYYLRKSLE